jgi:hypothetical protein
VALKSTIFKAVLQVADIDHGYYADHALTLARHPSETDERMMVRLAALAIHAHELVDVCRGDGTLAFSAGLSNPDDPDHSSPCPVFRRHPLAGPAPSGGAAPGAPPPNTWIDARAIACYSQ